MTCVSPQFTAEATPYYMVNREMVAELRAVVPHTRIIVCIRNPADRLLSECVEGVSVLHPSARLVPSVQLLLLALLLPLLHTNTGRAHMPCRASLLPRPPRVLQIVVAACHVLFAGIARHVGRALRWDRVCVP
jgi:hypothetical protein